MLKINSLATGWLNPSDLENQYGISKSAQAILRMKKRQENDEYPLPFTKIGKRILYKVEQIEFWLNAKNSFNYSAQKF